jgi:hypothetical protein
MDSDETILSFPAERRYAASGKGIHFVEFECYLHRMDALPLRFALAGHDNIDSM